MSLEANNLEIARIRNRVNQLDEQIQFVFEKESVTYDVPDALPVDWCKKKLKIRIPMDMLNESHIEIMLKKLKELISERRTLRDREASIMLNSGMIKIEQTVPE